jgi:hypothetical protein
MIFRTRPEDGEITFISAMWCCSPEYQDLKTQYIKILKIYVGEFFLRIEPWSSRR